MTKARLLICAVAAALLGACGESTKVGEGLEVKDSGGNIVIRNTPTPPPTPTPKGGGPTPAPTPPPKAATPPPADEPVSLEIAITAKGFEPQNNVVYAGSRIRVINRDKDPRSMEGDKAEFNSGTLQPGQSWVNTFNTPGKINMHDGTRPFVVGTIDVLAR